MYMCIYIYIYMYRERDIKANGENLHFRNIGDVMMQEKMKEAQT